MKMFYSKILLLQILLGLGLFVPAQSNFPYLQDWGTYIGGTGTIFGGNLSNNGFSIDSQNRIYLNNGQVYFRQGYNQSYYNQFVTGGGNNADFGINNNLYSAVLSSTGQILKSGYNGNNFGTFANFNYLLHIDDQDNKYYLKKELGNISNLATSGVWLTQNIYTTLPNNYTVTLSKYNANNNLVWTTYLPNNINNDGGAFTIESDQNQNIYLVGTTQEEIPNLSTPNVYQENYINYSTGSVPSKNYYLVKLNNNGQKIWATYSNVGIQDVNYYTVSLYILGHYGSGIPGNFATSGAFQNTPAKNVIMKMDANTGQRTWSTYYGTPNLVDYNGLNGWDIEVTESGVYISGQTEDTYYPDYYATTGAFQTQLSGGGDLFLTKFNYNGDRIWSTYFGSSQYDDILGGGNLSVKGNRIIITGNQYGNTDNIATPNAFSTTPANNYDNMFFAEFDTDGNRNWCSYLGGVAANYNIWGNYIHPILLNDESLILWGNTNSPTGIATANGTYPNMTNPYPGDPFGFITKFVLKERLGTSEVKNEDLHLFDNPNNGNFYISGSVLTKKNCTMLIYDLSGRLIKKQPLNNNEKQYFNYEKILASGSYILTISDHKEEKLKTFKMIVR